jgi:uncharacterized membrane protein
VNGTAFATLYRITSVSPPPFSRQADAFNSHASVARQYSKKELLFLVLSLLQQMQKRPTIEAKETYHRGKSVPVAFSVLVAFAALIVPGRSRSMVLRA